MLFRTVAFVAAAFSTTPCFADKVLYVAASGGGSACTISAPCSNLQSAIGAAGVGDTIVCLSPPFSSTLNITKSLTIDCSTARAPIRDSIILTASPNTISQINIPPSSNDPLRTVRLRGLTIEGASSDTISFSSGRAIERGIDIVAAATVFIEDCIISNFNQNGIYDHRTGGQTSLFIKDSLISNNATGIVLVSQNVGITVLDNVRIERNGYGIATGTGNNVLINRSVVSGNTIAGVEADSGAKINISNTAFSHNNIALQAFGTVRLQENSFQFNNTALQGATTSLGANRLAANGANGPTPTLATGAQADVLN